MKTGTDTTLRVKHKTEIIIELVCRAWTTLFLFLFFCLKSLRHLSPNTKLKRSAVTNKHAMLYSNLALSFAKLNSVDTQKCANMFFSKHMAHSPLFCSCEKKYFDFASMLQYILHMWSLHILMACVLRAVIGIVHVALITVELWFFFLPTNIDRVCFTDVSPPGLLWTCMTFRATRWQSCIVHVAQRRIGFGVGGLHACVQLGNYASSFKRRNL